MNADSARTREPCPHEGGVWARDCVKSLAMARRFRYRTYGKKQAPSSITALKFLNFSLQTQEAMNTTLWVKSPTSTSVSSVTKS